MINFSSKDALVIPKHETIVSKHETIISKHETIVLNFKTKNVSGSDDFIDLTKKTFLPVRRQKISGKESVQ